MANIVGVVGVMALLCMVSDEWWVSGPLVPPRAPWGLPALVLLIASAFRAPLDDPDERGGPAGGRARRSWDSPLPPRPFLPHGDSAVTVVSSNIQFGSSQPLKLGMEFERLHPQILMLQEAHAGTEAFTKQLEGWSMVHVGEFLVASPHPVRLIDEFRFEPFDRRGGDPVRGRPSVRPGPGL